MTAVYAGEMGFTAIQDLAGNAEPTAVVYVLKEDLTDATLYADRLRAAPLANPLPIGATPGEPGVDPYGNASAYLDPGHYLLSVTDGVDELFRAPFSVHLDPDEPGVGGGADTANPLAATKIPIADGTGDVFMAAADTTWAAGLGGGGNIKDVRGIVARPKYTQTSTPTASATDLTRGTQFMALWDVIENYSDGFVGPIAQGNGNAFGPRGCFQVEGTIRYKRNMSFTVVPPVGFANQIFIRTEDGVARNISGGFGFIANAYYFADNAACTMLQNDTAKGPTGFVANDIVAGQGTGSWDGTTHDVALTGFLSSLNVVSNSHLSGIIGVDFNDSIIDGSSSVDEQRAVNIPRLLAATRNVGVKCDSPVELWTDFHTHDAAPPLAPVQIGPGIHLLDYANATFPSPANVTLALVMKQGGNAFSNLAGVFKSALLYKNDTTLTGELGPLSEFFANSTIQGDTHATTLGSYVGLNVGPSYQAINGGTLAVAGHKGLFDQPAVGAGVTLAARSGLLFNDYTGLGAVTLQAAVDIAALTKAGTNLSIRSAGAAVQARHRGSLILGSGGVTTAPAALLDVFQETVGTEVLRLRSVATNDDPTVQVFQNRVTTTDATATVAHNVPISASKTYSITVHAVGRRTGGSAGTAEDGICHGVNGCFKTVSGTVTQIQTTDALYISESTLYNGVTFAINGASVDVKVGGLANTNMTWHVEVHVRAVGT